ncbi:MAG: alcohol dehydrogenase catalytic domain-containing protein [Verrucomicrobia bacterium]|nr:alcohol dehydrogenase catalytic domain-containing protein [Verrucomicrobiota bacterium]
MAKMRAVQVPGPNKPLEVVEKEIPSPKRGTVRVKVQACGICHSDSFTKEGAFPGIQYPRVPGHEIAGIIDSLGEEAGDWKVGQRVGIGWNGGACKTCESCRRGDFATCSHMQVPGISYDGGYADYVIVPIDALALIPDELSAVEAAPLMCAGITTFNALRNSGAIAGNLVAILGIGGLGHLAIQYAVKMGFRTVAIARGKDKQPLSKKLGAHHYIDSESQQVSEELIKLGGAKVILSTVTNSKAINAAVNGLSVDGKLLIVGVGADPVEASPLFLIGGRRSIAGWPCGASIDSQDTMAFSSLTGVRSMNQVFPLEKAAEAYELMMSGKARFRVVLETGLK